MEINKENKFYVVTCPDREITGRIDRVQSGAMIMRYISTDPIVKKQINVDIISSDKSLYIRDVPLKIIRSSKPTCDSTTMQFRQCSVRFGLTSIIKKLQIQDLMHRLTSKRYAANPDDFRTLTQKYL
jgi:hypothetical protein